MTGALGVVLMASVWQLAIVSATISAGIGFAYGAMPPRAHHGRGSRVRDRRPTGLPVDLSRTRLVLGNVRFLAGFRRAWLPDHGLVDAADAAVVTEMSIAEQRRRTPGCWNNASVPR